MTVDEWVEAYGRAWREKDADAVVELFTEDAEYRSARSASHTSARTASVPTGRA
jgi:ketosteroid isomerase-like protein